MVVTVSRRRQDGAGILDILADNRGALDRAVRGDVRNGVHQQMLLAHFDLIALLQ
jgi:hypothetical protein